jgi:hypothetical protein
MRAVQVQGEWMRAVQVQGEWMRAVQVQGEWMREVQEQGEWMPAGRGLPGPVLTGQAGEPTAGRADAPEVTVRATRESRRFEATRPPRVICRRDRSEAGDQFLDTFVV